MAALTAELAQHNVRSTVCKAARKRIGAHSAAIIALVAISLLRPERSIALAYPVGFDAVPDWSGFTTEPPTPIAVVMRARTLQHAVIVVRLISKKPLTTENAVAHFAYDDLFKNVKHLPSGPVYVVVIVYGVETAQHLYPDYAYVFRRDSANLWKTRRVSEEELVTIECAIGHCPRSLPP
jgi:hypothetical protein